MTRRCVCASLLALVAICATSPSSTALAEATPAEQWPYLRQIKAAYDFSHWPGKNGPIRDGFGLQACVVKPLEIAKAYPGRPSVTRSALSVSRRYVLGGRGCPGKIEVTVVVAETCREAQEALVTPFAASSLPPEFRTPRDTCLGVALGDVWFVSRARNGFRAAEWVRNNVAIWVRAHSEDMRPFVKPLALAIDKAILARPTVKTYRQCKNRPVVKGIEMVAGKGWQITDAADPNGERLEQYPFNWAGETFPVLINESNLVGFPPSTTEWRTPKRDQLRRFLARYE